MFWRSEGLKSPTMHLSNISSSFFSSNLTSAVLIQKTDFFFVCFSSGGFVETWMSLGPARKNIRVLPSSLTKDLMMVSPSSVWYSLRKNSGLLFRSGTTRSQIFSTLTSRGASSSAMTTCGSGG